MLVHPDHVEASAQEQDAVAVAAQLQVVPVGVHWEGYKALAAAREATGPKHPTVNGAVGVMW